LPYELRVALRYLTARRKQAFVSLISGISILGVALGVMALLIALALMTGLQREIRSRILGTTAHVFVFKLGRGGITDYRSVIDTVRGVPGVEGAAPVSYGKALATTTTGQAFVTVKGIVPEAEASVTEIGRQVESSELSELMRPDRVPGILLGSDLAGTLGVAKGDVLTLVVPEGRLSPLGMLPRRANFRVAGTIRTGLFEFDAQWAYVALAEAQRLFEGGADRAGQIEVRVRDIYDVEPVEDRILDALGTGFVTDNWIRQNGNLFTALWLEKVAIGITIFLIVMVAALNIVATLILMVMEKHKDIAILVAMGASRGAIARIFVLQGAIIGAIGTTVGGLTGWAVCHVMDRYQLLKVQAEVYQLAYVPFKLLAWDAALVLVGAMLICLVAAVFPARGAARLDPAEAIRYE